MFGRHKRQRGVGSVDGGEGRGIPLGGNDRRPPTGYNFDDDDNDYEISDSTELDDRDFGAEEEGGGPDRRRDPLRR